MSSDSSESFLNQNGTDKHGILQFDSKMIRKNRNSFRGWKPQILSSFKYSGLHSKTHSLKFETPLCKFNCASPDEHSGHLSAKRLVILLLVSRTPKSQDALSPSIMKTPTTLPEHYDSLPGLNVDEL